MKKRFPQTGKKSLPFSHAKGRIRFNMTNDYLFRYILQKNRVALIGLISSLLHIRPEDILSIEITNPISLADQIDGKEFILDINILLNGNTRINLEMQMLNKKNWTDRSLSYLCRSFDQLYRGQEYTEALPVIHICFLNYSLFPEHPEFYAVHKLMNVKNHNIFSDKFILSVVSLKQTDLANQEDIDCGLNLWARLFNAETWEEITMLTRDNEYLQAAADSIYEANSDEIVRQRCYAREEYERHQRTIARDFTLMQNRISSLQEENAAMQNENSLLLEENAAMQNKNSLLQEENAAMQNKNSLLQEENAAMQNENSLLLEENSKKDAYIKELLQKLGELQD